MNVFLTWTQPQNELTVVQHMITTIDPVQTDNSLLPHGRSTQIQICWYLDVIAGVTNSVHRAAVSCG